MKLQIFSVHDQKAGAFLQPFFSLNVGTAQRSFETAVNDPATQFSRNPGDYTLFHIGEYEQDDASLTSLQTPENLGLALQFIKDSAPIVESEWDVIRDGRYYKEVGTVPPPEPSPTLQALRIEDEERAIRELKSRNRTDPTGNSFKVVERDRTGEAS